MKRYDLSSIMKSAHTMRKFRCEKYPTFSIAYHEAKRKEAQERKERVERVIAEHNAMLVSAKEEGQRKIQKISNVEATSSAYGYGLGYHYSAFSGWGNYVGD